MSLRAAFSKAVADMKARRARAKSYRQSYKVLNAAIGVGDTDAVHTLLTDKVVDINKPPRGVPSALAVAVQGKHDDTFSLLMKNGGDPNTSLHESGIGYIREIPLLSLAITSGNAYAARELASHPWIDPTQRGFLTAVGSAMTGGYAGLTQETPLELARKEGMDDVAALIEAHPALRNKKKLAKPAPRSPSLKP